MKNKMEAALDEEILKTEPPGKGKSDKLNVKKRNYYTNYLAKWNMLEAIRSMEA